MTRRVVSTDQAPKAIGPYSQAIEAGGSVFCSGQIGLDPATGALVAGGIRAETDRALKNLEGVLRAAGCGWGDVVRTTVYLLDMADFEAMNEVYGIVFRERPPARSTIQAAALPRGARVEIDAIAVKPA